MHVLVEIFMAQNTPIDTLFRYHDSGDPTFIAGLNIPAPESLFRCHDPGRCGYQNVEPEGIRGIVYTRLIASGTRTSSARARLARAQVWSAFHLLRNAAIWRKICGEFGDLMDDFLL
jgi:hypothetical protein